MKGSSIVIDPVPQRVSNIEQEYVRTVRVSPA